VNYTLSTTIRPAAGEVVCGDAFAVIERPDALLIAVVDGLGHGPGAAEASAAFLEYVQSDPDRPLGELMLACSAAIRPTRGAAASLARLDTARCRLEYCGVGNCHFHAVAPARISPVSVPGIVGHRIRKVMPAEFDLPGNGVFAICSDGISSRLHLEKYTDGDPNDLADRLLADHGKDFDDATIVAITYEAPCHAVA
jgi:hypothetical protein